MSRRFSTPRLIVYGFVALMALGTVLLTLMVSDRLALLPALFEITSPFGITGLSMDVTPDLSPFGKVLVARS